MGRKRGALIQLPDYCDVSRPYIIHCLNHNLELAIKDSYSKIQNIKEIKESLHILLKMMKDSGKTWDAFRAIGDCLGVKVLRYTKVTVNSFPGSCAAGFVELSEEFLVHAIPLQRMLWNRVRALTR